ncbi:hypothetical protein QTP88_029117 [Uroleucon formosanum]
MMRIIQLILNKKKTITLVTNIENTIIDDRYNLTEDSIQNSDNNDPTTSQVNNELYINNIEIESTIDDRYNLIEDSKQNNDYNEPTTSQESNELNINFNDPGCWPTMTSRFRDLIVERGPYLMDQNNYFPVNDEDVNQKMQCLLFSNNDIRKSTFSNNGFKDWKHLNPSVAEHENSKNHKQNVLDWKELEKRLRDCKTIDYALQNSIKNEKEKWFCILKVIVDGILFCAKNNLALRGSSDKIGEANCGIFFKLNGRQIDKVNLSLQNQNQTIDVATKSLEGLIECIQNIRENGFENAFNKAKKIAILINIPTDFLTIRKIKRKKYDLESNETETNKSSETIVKLQCYQSLDSIITSLKWRFKKMYNISSNFSFLSGRNLSTMGIDDIKTWSDDLLLLYSVDLNGGELYTEVQSFKFQASRLIESFKTATCYDFLKCIHQHSLQDVYPNFGVALRIFLTMPVTTAT